MTKSITDNWFMRTDAYKNSHYLQYPADISYIEDYFESRGESIKAGDKYVLNKARFFGLQIYIKKYLAIPFTQEDIDQAEPIIKGIGLPFNREGWEHILHAHGGLMPVRIRAVKEGALVPSHNVLMTIDHRGHAVLQHP